MNRRQMLGIIRIAAAEVAIDAINSRHKIVQVILLVIAAIAAFADQWIIFGLLVACSLALFVVARLVVGLIKRLGTPRKLRKALHGIQGGITEEFERIGLPTGPIASGLFALRLVRGKQPHRELAERASEAVPRLQALMEGAFTDSGLREFLEEEDQASTAGP